MAEIIKENNIAKEIKIVSDAVILEMAEVDERVKHAELNSRRGEASEGIAYMAELRGMLRLVAYLTERVPGYDGGHDVDAAKVEEIVQKGKEKFSKAKEIVEYRASLGE